VTDERLLLGLDLGTGSVKVVLATVTGRIVGQGSAEYPIDRPRPDRAEQDPEAWWRGVTRATHAALDDAAAEPASGADAADRVVAIGLAGQMHGTVLISAAHQPLAPAVIWPDQRSRREAAALTEELGLDEVIRLIGGPIASGFQASTIRWLRRHQPRLLDQAAVILAPKDALRLRLTGEIATEPSDGSGTGLMNSAVRRWSPELMTAVGVEPDRLPEMQEATTVAGGLRPAAALELGLPAGIPVVVGAADTPAGLLGAGLIRPDAFLLTISTGGQIAVPSATSDADPSGRSHTFCSALAPEPETTGWYRMAAILSAGLALHWLRDSVFALAGPDAYREMLSWAATVPPGSRGLVFLPYLLGERNPHMDPNARGVLLGLTASHGRAELARAVVEGITLGCFDASRTLADAGRLPSSIILGGGGGRSVVWQQIVADVFGLPVRHLETGEQAALGACLLAGGGAGALDLASAARHWARLGPPVEPDAFRHEIYERVYEIFRAGYPRMREDFERLRSLPE
jgi:xylulokinase